MCSPDIVGNYLQLDAKLSEFARSQVYAVDIMQSELQVIADILVLLDQELQSDAAGTTICFWKPCNKIDLPQATTPATGHNLQRHLPIRGGQGAARG